MRFPAPPRERIAVASYPFRDFIAGREDRPGGGKMELKEFAAKLATDQQKEIQQLKNWAQAWFGPA